MFCELRILFDIFVEELKHPKRKYKYTFQKKKKEKKKKEKKEKKEKKFIRLLDHLKCHIVFS
jgi:hypothetical protein